MGKNSKDKRDLYYRRAKEEGYRARSAYKLLQLNEEFHFLDDPKLKRVVDLCAAPGSWSQVLSQKLFGASATGETGQTAQVSGDSLDDGKVIVAVDLQPMSPIPYVTTLQADITHPNTLRRILSLFGNKKAQFVCSDGAPDVTGLHELDEYIQQQLVLSALQLATCILEPGGCFVAKIFRGRDIDLLYSQLGYLFEKVVCAKPRASRGSSLEAFVVGIGFRCPEGWEPKLDTNVSVEEFFKGLKVGRGKSDDDDDESLGHWSVGEREIAEFMSCGDLSSFDSDATYSLGVNESDGDKLSHRLTGMSLDPVQSPTNPPYKRALELKRSGKLGPKVV